MNPSSARELLARVESMRASIAALADVVQEQGLPEPDRRYLSRCIDLLEMELAAIREYVERPVSEV